MKRILIKYLIIDAIIIMLAVPFFCCKKQNEGSQAPARMIEEDFSNSSESTKEEAPQPVDTGQFYTVDFPDSNTQNNVKCRKARIEACGVVLEECNDGNNYYCFHNIRIK